jgi:putative redox protein
MSGPIEKIDGRPKNNSFSFRAAGVHNEAHIESTRGTAMEVTTHRGQGPLQQVIEIGPHRLLTDVGPESGGEASGPAPHDLLAAALAACTTLTVNLYAKRKGWQLDEVQVRVAHGQEGDAYVLHRTIRYLGRLSEEEKARLTDIANHCPVHKTLSGPIRITTTEAK